jgi:hypothetical protein
MRRTKKKINFFTKHLRCFTSPEFVVIVAILAVLSAGIGALDAVNGKSTTVSGKQIVSSPELKVPPVVTSEQAVFISEPEDATSTSERFSPNLAYDIGVYVYSKKSDVCNDYKNVINQNYFSMRCKVASGIWRGHMVKKVDVAGYKKLRVKAGLGVNDYTDYFAECGHRGVNRADFVALAALSFNPEDSWRWDCNHEVNEDLWHKCQLKKSDPGVMAYCGVPMCARSANCDFEIDVSKKEAVYLVFSANDAWVADIEGSLSNVEYILTK